MDYLTKKDLAEVERRIALKLAIITFLAGCLYMLVAIALVGTL